jgi:hypothetical protein
MKILNFLIVMSFVFFNSAFALGKTKKTQVASAIPYCSKKVTRGCVKPHYGQTAKFYSTPKYTQKAASHKSAANHRPAVSHKMAKHIYKLPKKKIAAKSNINSKAKSKSVAKNTTSKFHKNKQYKRDMASVLEERLKAHNKKKSDQ